MLIPLVCKICKKVYHVKPYRSKISKCCSRACLWHITRPDIPAKKYNKGKKAHNNAGVFINCLKCNKKVNISPSRIGIQYFCSKKCYETILPKKEKGPYQKVTIKSKTRVLSHRIIYEKFHKIKIPKYHVIHHIDGNHKNNSIDNLQMMTLSEHTRLHSIERAEIINKLKLK